MTRNGKKRRKIIGFCFVYVIGVVKALKLKHGRSDFLSKFSLWFLEFGTQSVSFYCWGMMLLGALNSKGACISNFSRLLHWGYTTSLASNTLVFENYYFNSYQKQLPWLNSLHSRSPEKYWRN